MGRILRLLVTGAGTLVVAVVACNTYNSTLLDGRPSSGGTGGTGGSAGVSGSAGMAGAAGSTPAMECHWGYCWWSTKSVEGCDDVGMPTDKDVPKPTGDAPADVGDIYLGMTQLWTGETMPPASEQAPTIADPSKAKSPYQWIGLNLDGLCTNPVGCSAAPPDKVACKTAGGSVKPADGVGCRDNMFGFLEPTAAVNPYLGIPYGVNENDFNCEIRRGGFNVLFKISQYNGTVNDDQVRVDVYESPGLEKVGPFDCITEKDTWKGEAPWVLLQPWYVDAAGLDGAVGSAGTLPPAKSNYDPSAYVKNGYLVAHIPDGESVRFIGDRATQRPGNQGQNWPSGAKVPNGISFTFYGGRVVGHLHKNSDSAWAIDDGVLAGAIKKTDLIESFNDIGFCADTIPLTDGGSPYDTLIAFTDTYMDVLSTGDVAPSADCDAMSTGIGFTATTITPGTAWNVSKLNHCAPATPAVNP